MFTGIIEELGAVDAVQPRHHDIEHDDRIIPRHRLGNRPRGIALAAHREALLGEVVAHQSQQLLIIVDQ